MPGSHTSKQKRMARHIYETAKRGGHDDHAAERIAWATVASFKKASAIEYGDNTSARGGAGTMAPKPPPQPKAPTPAPSITTSTPNHQEFVQRVPVNPTTAADGTAGTTVPPRAPVMVGSPGVGSRVVKADPPSMNAQFQLLNDKIRRRARRKKRIAKAGEAYLPRPKTKNSSPRERMSRMSYGTSGKRVNRLEQRMQGIKPLGTHTVTATAPASAPTRSAEKRFGFDAHGKSLRVVSIDEAHAMLKGEAGAMPAAPGAQPPPKRFPRGDKPTIKMKPISDGEAMANLKAGKFHEKSLRTLAAIKALVAGYGNLAGADALRSANRGSLSIHDLNRAMEVMPKPKGAVPPPTTYLPGVHGPDVKQRAAKIRSQARTKKPAAASAAAP